MSNETTKLKALEILRADSFENYDSADAVTESVLTELESKQELTIEQASLVGEVREEWFSKES